MEKSSLASAGKGRSCAKHSSWAQDTGNQREGGNRFIFSGGGEVGRAPPGLVLCPVNQIKVIGSFLSLSPTILSGHQAGQRLIITYFLVLFFP